MFYLTDSTREKIEATVDEYGDSYARDVSVKELNQIFEGMNNTWRLSLSPDIILSQLAEHGRGLSDMQGSLFRGCVAYFTPAAIPDSAGYLETGWIRNRFLFAAGTMADWNDEHTTHIIVLNDAGNGLKTLREKVVALGRRKHPRFVGWQWVRDCWKECTLLDEERYAMV